VVRVLNQSLPLVILLKDGNLQDIPVALEDLMHAVDSQFVLIVIHLQRMFSPLAGSSQGPTTLAELNMEPPEQENSGSVAETPNN
jgi:hypothetical protein